MSLVAGTLTTRLLGGTATIVGGGWTVGGGVVGLYGLFGLGVKAYEHKYGTDLKQYSWTRRASDEPLNFLLVLAAGGSVVAYTGSRMFRWGTFHLRAR